MKVLVSGGTGFLGRHVVWRLARAGHEVCFTGRDARAAATVVQQAAAPVQFVAVEHGTEKALPTLLAQVGPLDVMIHCAALSSPWGALDDFRRANVESTRELLQLAEHKGVRRLVHISTPSLYFDFSDRLAIREDMPLPKPVNYYAATKAEAEQWVLQSELPECVILRPRALFGPWDNTLMPRLMRVIQRGAFPLPHGGKALLDLSYIDNVVDAVSLALTANLPASRRIYNVSNGEPISLLDLLKQLQTTLDLPLRTRRLPYALLDGVARIAELHAKWASKDEPLLTRYSAGTLAFSQTLDLSAIKNELGYAPKVSISEGLQRYAVWLKKHAHVV